MENEKIKQNYAGYTLVNPEKLDRALNGSVGAGGALIGGVGADASDEAILAEYDRLGGLITLNGRKIKMGSFYNFKGRKPHDKPDPIYVLTDITGDIVEIPVSGEIPLEVKAAEVAKARREEKAQKVADAKAAKKAASDAVKAGKKAPTADEAEEGDEGDEI